MDKDNSVVRARGSGEGQGPGEGGQRGGEGNRRLLLSVIVSTIKKKKIVSGLMKN